MKMEAETMSDQIEDETNTEQRGDLFECNIRRATPEERQKLKEYAKLMGYSKEPDPDA